MTSVSEPEPATPILMKSKLLKNRTQKDSKKQTTRTTMESSCQTLGYARRVLSNLRKTENQTELLQISILFLKFY